MNSPERKPGEEKEVTPEQLREWGRHLFHDSDECDWPGCESVLDIVAVFLRAEADRRERANERASRLLALVRAVDADDMTDGQHFDGEGEPDRPSLCMWCEFRREYEEMAKE